MNWDIAFQMDQSFPSWPETETIKGQVSPDFWPFHIQLFVIPKLIELFMFKNETRIFDDGAF